MKSGGNRAFAERQRRAATLRAATGAYLSRRSTSEADLSRRSSSKAEAAGVTRSGVGSGAWLGVKLQKVVRMV